MMKHNWKICRQYLPWLLLLLGTDGVFVLLLWLADIQALKAFAAFLVLGTLLLFSAVLSVVILRENRRQKAFLAFLHTPEEYQEEQLLRLSGAAEKDMIRILGAALRQKQEEYQLLQGRISDYEDYVEAWAHEIKTPVSLLTMLIDNRRDDMPEHEQRKLDYIRNRMQESVNQMLFYARLKSARKDYLLETLSLSECVEDVLEDYRPLLEGKGFLVSTDICDAAVFSDRRGLHFLLSQVISNCVKYCRDDIRPELSLFFIRKESHCSLIIRDNGMGVRSSDLPYIFEKGFTGDSGEGRKRATGMGLYLAKEIAGDLKLTLEADSRWGEGFVMKIIFPVV